MATVTYTVALRLSRDVPGVVDARPLPAGHYLSLCAADDEDDGGRVAEFQALRRLAADHDFDLSQVQIYLDERFDDDRDAVRSAVCDALEPYGLTCSAFDISDPSRPV